MQQFNLFDLLPMPPWEGPPLPRFLGIRWPGLGNNSEVVAGRFGPTPPDLSNLMRSAGAVSTYSNGEYWDIEWNDDGLPVKVVVHRKAVRSG